MPALVTDLGQLKRRKVNPTPPDKPAVSPSTDPGSPAPLRASPLVAALTRMNAKNPAVMLLLEQMAFEPVSVVLPPGHERLWQLAGESLDGWRTYTRAEAIERIRQRTQVTTERAERGFVMMLEAKAIERAPNPELFFLGGTAPF